MKKTKLAALLASCLVISMLAGCGQQAAGSSESSSEAQTQQSSEQTQVSASSEVAEESYDPFGKYEDGITVTVACNTQYMQFDAEKEGFKSMEDNLWITAYKELLGIDIEYIWTAAAEDYETKWTVAIASGDIPDVAIVNANVYDQLMKAGLVEDMTDYFEQYASEQYKEALEFEGGLAADFITQNGRMYGLPHTGTTPKGGQQLFIRKDWLDAVNLPVPTTIEELVTAMRAFVDAKLGGEDTVGMVGHKDLAASGQCDLLGFFDSFGAHLRCWVEDDNGKLVYGAVTPEVKEALQFLQDMYAEGLLLQDFAVRTNAQAAEIVGAGKCGVEYGSYWAAGFAGNAKLDANAEWINIDGVTNDGSPFVSGVSAKPGNYIFVKKGTEHPEAIVKLMNLQLKARTEGTELAGAEDYVQGQYFSVSPFMNIAWANETNALIIDEAIETGDISLVEGSSREANYYKILASKMAEESGSIDEAWEMLLEKGLVEDLKGEEREAAFRGMVQGAVMMWEETIPRGLTDFENGGIYVDKFTSRYSEFGNTNFSTIRDELFGAYMKIIMGDDINNFETAVETWMKTGGEQITNEVNEWYSTQ